MLKAPFPWFGGKSRAAELIWSRLGDVSNYVEPFAGSLAVLLARESEPRIETVNDRDCYLANFWRAVSADPVKVARHADWPVNEADLRARHQWLCSRAKFRERMLADPHYCDAKIAGWWVWGVSQWIGSGWCSHPEWIGRGQGQRAPRGLNTLDSRKPHLSSRNGIHIWKNRPQLTNEMGVHAKRPVVDWLLALSERLRRVRVCCGDWARIVTPSCTWKLGGGTLTGVVLDPPYDLRVARSSNAGSAGAAPTDKLYSFHDNDLSADVRKWAIMNGDNPRLRIALCGLADEHSMPPDWEAVEWKAPSGYSRKARREVIWFSPHCLKQETLLKIGLQREREVLALL
jgi:hypothetical protein